MGDFGFILSVTIKLNKKVEIDFLRFTVGTLFKYVQL